MSPKKKAPEPPRVEPNEPPKTEPEPIYAVPDKSRKGHAPLKPAEPKKEIIVETRLVPDVGEERLEHMRKMNELKTLMPEREFEYYSRLVSIIMMQIFHSSPCGNSVDPDQTAPKEQSDQGLHFLPFQGSFLPPC